MKKIIAVALVLCCVFAFAGCSGSSVKASSEGPAAYITLKAENSVTLAVNEKSDVIAAIYKDKDGNGINKATTEFADLTLIEENGKDVIDAINEIAGVVKENGTLTVQISKGDVDNAETYTAKLKEILKGTFKSKFENPEFTVTLEYVDGETAEKLFTVELPKEESTSSK